MELHGVGISVMGQFQMRKDPNHTYRNKGQYLVTLTATNSEQCNRHDQ